MLESVSKEVVEADPVSVDAKTQRLAAELSCEPPRIKVLVVDDDPADRLLIERSLSHMARFEPQITTAGTLATARFCLTADEFDIVIADWHIGTACGTDILEQVSGECPVVLLSGALTPAMRRQALALGATAVMAKDKVDEKSIASVIERAVAAHARRASAAALATDSREICRTDAPIKAPRRIRKDASVASIA